MSYLNPGGVHLGGGGGYCTLNPKPYSLNPTLCILTPKLVLITGEALTGRVSVRVETDMPGNDNPQAQNSPKALYSMVFGPKSLTL